MIIETRELVYEIRDYIKSEVDKLKDKPKLTIIQVEGDAASDSYVKNKKKLGAELGIEVMHHLLPNTLTQEEYEIIVKAMNQTDADGIIVQLPLPSHVNERVLLE